MTELDEFFVLATKLWQKPFEELERMVIEDTKDSPYSHVEILDVIQFLSEVDNGEHTSRRGS